MRPLICLICCLWGVSFVSCDAQLLRGAGAGLAGGGIMGEAPPAGMLGTWFEQHVVKSSSSETATDIPLGIGSGSLGEDFSLGRSEAVDLEPDELVVGPGWSRSGFRILEPSASCESQN